jgi:hypothetical protein
VGERRVAIDRKSLGGVGDKFFNSLAKRQSTQRETWVGLLPANFFLSHVFCLARLIS